MCVYVYIYIYMYAYKWRRQCEDAARTLKPCRYENTCSKQ